MTRLAAGGRAPQPGLACRWHFWRTGRANRKAAIQAAAQRALGLSDAPGSVPKVIGLAHTRKSLYGRQRRRTEASQG